MRDVALAAEADHGVDIRVVSVAETRRWYNAAPAACDGHPPLVYAPRPFHTVSIMTDGSLAHERHGALREYAERMSAALALRPVLARLRAASGARYVHFFDNFGPAAAAVGRSVGLQCGVSLLSSNGDSRRTRRAFWRVSCTGMHDVVAGSLDLAQELSRSGVRVRAVIPWAASYDSHASHEPYSTRHRMIWTGPLGPSGIDELRLALVAMTQVSAALPDAFVEVWPKPEYRRTYAAVAAGLGVQARDTGTRFVEALSKVKVMVSPVPGPSYIVGPPLTWLEAVSRGCTVVTTPCRGIPSHLVAGGGVVVARDRSAGALGEAIAKAWHGAGPNVDALPTARDAAASYVELWRHASERLSSATCI